MCGRYLRRSDKQRIAESFHTRNDISTLAMPPDDFNIAPSTFQPVIRESKDEGSRELVMMRWGLVPFFTKQLSKVKGMATINARAESVRTSPTWREPFKKRRCLVPVSGFYEWHKVDAKTRKPYVFTVADSSVFAFAGLWDAWKGPDVGWLQSFSIMQLSSIPLNYRYDLVRLCGDNGEALQPRIDILWRFLWLLPCVP